METRSGVSASKLALLMQSASRVGTARRTNDASRRRSSRSSCTTKQRPAVRLAPVMIDSCRSLLTEGLLLIGRLRYFDRRNAIRNFVLTAVDFPPGVGGL